MIWTAASTLLVGLSCGAASVQDPGQPRLSPAKDPPAAFDEADLNERVTPVVKAVRRAQDSVVSIYVLDRDQRSARLRGTNVEGQGSGVIIDDSGLCITNWHVVALAVARPEARQVQARMLNGKSYLARILNVSKENDLALLELQLDRDEKVKPVAIGDSDSLMVGETLVAIGNPQGQAHTVTVGVLSAVGRDIRARTPFGDVMEMRNLLQTDAAINQGNSGGALLDITGRLVGINNAMAQGAENIGFAIPVDTVQRVFRELLVGSTSFSLWLGVDLRDDDGGRGVRVTGLYPDGPAARAGLQPGDRIVAAEGRPVATTVDYARALLEARPGEQLPLAVQRDGRVLDVSPVPMTAAEGFVLRCLGVELDVRSDAQALEYASRAFSRGLRYRVPWMTALRVRRVLVGGPAAEIGVAEGDILLGATLAGSWGRRQVVPFDDLSRLVEVLQATRGNDLPIVVLRDGDTLDGHISVR